MPIVPFTRTAGQYGEPDTTGPGSNPPKEPPQEYWPSNGIQTDKSMMTKAPDTTYLMMAAAQMHKEGRLVKVGAEETESGRSNIANYTRGSWAEDNAEKLLGPNRFTAPELYKTPK